MFSGGSKGNIGRKRDKRIKPSSTDLKENFIGKYSRTGVLCEFCEIFENVENEIFEYLYSNSKWNLHSV